MLVLLAVVGLFAVFGVPLLWLYVASQLAPTSTGLAYLVCGAGILGSMCACAYAMGSITARWREGRTSGARRVDPWRRSMRDAAHEDGADAADAVVIAVVICAIIAMTVWFLGFAGSPLPRS